MEERHTLCTQETHNVREQRGGQRKEQGVNGEREECDTKEKSGMRMDRE